MGLRKLSIPPPCFTHRDTALDHESVSVTGNWSLLGSWVVRLLLQQNYRVKSTIPLSAEETSLLLLLPGAQERLQFAEVDLLDYCSLSELFEGCTGVFYVPAPNYDINGMREYPAEIIDNEVRAVLNVVEACANAASVRKLVLTSCLSCIVWDKPTGMVLDERNWSDLDFCRKEKMWAAVSKTLAERAAWALATDKGLDLVVMNPATVVKNGPSASTSALALDQSGIFGYVHVDDLAAAHILALEADRAAGRYICFERLLTETDIVEAARELYPNYPVSTRLESFNPCLLSNEKLKDLGMKFPGNSMLEVQALMVARDS